MENTLNLISARKANSTLRHSKVDATMMRHLSEQIVNELITNEEFLKDFDKIELACINKMIVERLGKNRSHAVLYLGLEDKWNDNYCSDFVHVGTVKGASVRLLEEYLPSLLNKCTISNVNQFIKPARFFRTAKVPAIFLHQLDNALTERWVKILEKKGYTCKWSHPQFSQSKNAKRVIVDWSQINNQ